MTVNANESARLLGIPGSIRREANNLTILRSLREALAGKAEMDIFSLNEIPPYNPDLEGENLPKPVRALKTAIAQSKGLVICSPEYNYGMPGVLKNALDWASRPGFKSPLRDKPVLIMTSSPGYTGGVRAQYQIRETLSATLARVVARPQVVIASVSQKIQDGRLIDDATIRFMLEAIDDLIREIRLAQHLTDQVA